MLETPASPRPAPAPERSRPFGGKRRLLETVPVRLPGDHRRVLCDVAGKLVRPGERVVVAFGDGEGIVEVLAHVERQVLASPPPARLVRLATPEDEAKMARLAGRARDAVHAAVRVARRHRLEAKIAGAFVPLAEDRVVIFYSAERRGQLHNFAKDVAGQVNMRVDLRSMGVREAAHFDGACSPTELEGCARGLLDSVGAISLRFAKDQGISLNPQRVTGSCGRLKCSLVYEQSTYKEMKAYAPKRRMGVITPNGPGEILDVEPVARRAMVRLQNVGVQSFRLQDIVVFDRPLTAKEIQDASLSKEERAVASRLQRRGDRSSRGAVSTAPQLPDDYLWEGVQADVEVSGEVAEGNGEGAAKKRRRRRKKPADGQRPAEAQANARPPKQARTPTAEGAPAGDSKPEGAAAGAARKRRRPRKRPSGPKGDAPAGRSGGEGDGGA